MVDIACGSLHSACVTEDGSLYTWGRGNYGRLGHGTNDDKVVPTKIVTTRVRFFIFYECMPVVGMLVLATRRLTIVGFAPAKLLYGSIRRSVIGASPHFPELRTRKGGRPLNPNGYVWYFKQRYCDICIQFIVLVCRNKIPEKYFINSFKYTCFS